MDGGFAKLDGHFAHIGKVARHLVDAIEIRTDGRARVTRKHMRLQVRHDGVANFLWNRTGGDRVTRPGHHRQSQQQDIPIAAVRVQLGRFRRRLDEFGKHIVRDGVALEGVIQRGLQHWIVAALDCLADQRRNFSLPYAILSAATGNGQTGGKRNQTLGIAGQAEGGFAANAFHGGIILLRGGALYRRNKSAASGESSYQGDSQTTPLEAQ